MDKVNSKLLKACQVKLTGLNLFRGEINEQQ